MMHLKFVSFGLKNGGMSEQECWKIFNLRKLPNPDYSIRKKHTGLSKELQQNLFNDSQVRSIYKSIVDEINKDLSSQKGKNLIIACGCHSGKHRR